MMMMMMMMMMWSADANVVKFLWTRIVLRTDYQLTSSFFCTCIFVILVSGMQKIETYTVVVRTS